MGFFFGPWHYISAAIEVKLNHLSIQVNLKEGIWVVFDLQGYLLAHQ